MGTILSNVLKKRSCISRTAPRLLCTLEPGKARVVDGHRGAGERDGSRPRPGCIQGYQGTDDPAVLKKPPRGLCTRWGSEGGCPFQPRLRHLLCFGFPGSQTSREVCGLVLDLAGRRERQLLQRTIQYMLSPESLWCVCVGVGEGTSCAWVRSRSPPGLVRTGPSCHHLVFTYPCFSRLCLSPRLLGHLASLLRVLRAWPWHLRLVAEGSGKGWPLCLPAELELCAHLSLEWPQRPPGSSWSPKYPPFPLSTPSGTCCHPTAADSARHWVPKGGMRRRLSEPRGFFVFLHYRSI